MTTYHCDACQDSIFSTQAEPQFCPFCAESGTISQYEIDYRSSQV